MEHVSPAFPSPGWSRFTICLFSTVLCALFWFAPAQAFQTDENNGESDFPAPSGTIEKAKIDSVRSARQSVVSQNSTLASWGKLSNDLIATPLYCHVGMIYQSQNDWRRFLLVRIGLENTSPVDLKISIKDELKLQCDGLSLTPDLEADRGRNASIWLNERYISINTMEFASDVTVPANGVASCWVIFKNIPLDARIPQLSLSWNLPGFAPATYDLRAWEKERLQLSMRAVGPQNCIGICQVHGEMTTVNIGDLTEAADQFVNNGVHRILITWGEKAQPISRVIDSWVRNAIRNFRTSHEDQRFSSSPLFPQSVIALEMGPFPRSESSQSKTPAESPERLTPRETDQNELLKTLLALINDLSPQLTRKEILNDLDSDDILLRCLSIQLAGPHLTSADLDWLTPLLSDESRIVQLSALQSIGQLNSSKAATLIEQYARDHAGDFRQHALAQMAGSRQPEMISAFLQLTQQVPEGMQSSLIMTAADYPRAQWVRLIQQGTQTGDQLVRARCLEQLQQIDDAQFEPLALKALKDDSMPQAQNVAFDLLSKTYNSDVEGLLRQYVLTRLKTNRSLRNTELQFLARDKNPDDALLLIQLLASEEQKSGTRLSTSEILETIQTIGDERVAVPLRTVIGQLEERDHKEALKTLFIISPPQFEQFAVSIIASDEQPLQKPLLELLSQLPSSLAFRLVVTRLNNDTLPEADVLSVLLNPLQKSYDPQVRELLVAMRSTANAEQTKLINNSLEKYYSHSPAQVLMSRLNDSIENQRWDILIDQLGIVLRADPLFPHAWRMKAIANSQLMKLEDAIDNYTQLIAIDDHFEEVYKRRAMLYAATGQHGKAVEDFDAALKQDADNAELYASRGACLVELGKTMLAENDYQNSLKYIEERSDVLTSIAILEALLGKIDAGERRLNEAEPNHRNEEYFHYNKACFYGRALQTFPANRTDAQQKEYARLQAKGIEALKAAVETGFSELQWMQNDADLQAFRGLEEFLQLCNPDAPDGNGEPDQQEQSAPNAAANPQQAPNVLFPNRPVEVDPQRPLVRLMRLLRPAPTRQLLSTLNVELLSPPDLR